MTASNNGDSNFVEKKISPSNAAGIFLWLVNFFGLCDKASDYFFGGQNFFDSRHVFAREHQPRFKVALLCSGQRPHDTKVVFTGFQARVANFRRDFAFHDAL